MYSKIISLIRKQKAREMSVKRPLVVILGATGSGKTKLSLDLAENFGGEIIGADSMQIYKKLNIISAKATVEERKVAPHHMIDKLDPHEVCTVLDFRNEAVTIIDQLLANNSLPIIVGGTNYYIESILWKILIEQPGEKPIIKPWEFRVKNPHLTSTELHEKLKLLDPTMACRLHPNNKRKIIRALEIFEKRGRKVSEIFKEQHSAHDGNSQGGGLRYRDTIIFWLQWDQATLDDRINRRVDAMIEEGLIDELLGFHNDYNATRINDNSEIDYTRGIYQMIGLKEFHRYLIMTPVERTSEVGRKALLDGTELLKQVTRRYARKQVRWIKNRFLGRGDREVPPLYALRADNVEQWDENITKPAIKIIESFMSGTPCEYDPEAKLSIKSLPNSQDDTFFCDTCERTFVGNFQWSAHLKSRKHKLRLAKAKRMAENVNHPISSENKTNSSY